jgi:hypothetical protein
MTAARDQGCVMCKHWIYPEGNHHALAHIRDTEHHVSGQCSLHPVRIETKSNHFCGQIKPLKHMREMYLRVAIWGSWRDNERDALAKQVPELRRQLAAARQISASRLDRLEKLTGRKPRKQKPPAAAAAEDGDAHDAG